MIKLLNSGFYTTIQDKGRFGCQKYGVPYSGVMDANAASIANTLLGNDDTCAVIEMTLIGVKLEFNCETLICLSGADMSPKVNGNLVHNNKAIAIQKGDVLSFGKLKKGIRCYLAVKGGFQTEKVFESYSMYHQITKKITLTKGDTLVVANSKVSKKKYASVKINTGYLSSKIIEVYKGPEFNCLAKKEQDILFSKTFTISKNNNRMAYQLEEEIENQLDAIVTSLVLPGTIQLTPSGKLIVLMRDCQTTGGYPRVLQLKESAINILAQKFTGNTIVFKLIDY